MKYIPSGITNDNRGKLGGVCFSKNGQANYARMLTIPVDRKSINQFSQRALHANLARRWRSVDPSYQIGWKNLALQFPRLNSLHQTYYLSAIQMYMYCNRNLQSLKRPFIDIAPNITQNIFQDILGLSFSIILTPGSEDISMAFTQGIDSNTWLVIQSTGPISNGISSPTNYKTLRFCDDSFITGSSIKSSYMAVFGSMPYAGDLVYFKVWQIKKDSGFAGSKIKTFSRGVV